VAALGLFLVVGYWLQNNALFGSLERADNRFAALSIVQLLFLLLYLFSMGLGIDFEQPRWRANTPHPKSTCQMCS